MAIRPSPEELFKSWSNEFEVTSKRVRNLIGGSHWLSDGKHKESIIKNFLRKYTLDRYEIASGFIVSNVDPECRSGEIDVLVVSRTKDIPWFSESDLMIVPPGCVEAHIHVKSKYSKASMKNILKSIGRANQSLSEGDIGNGVHSRVWSAGFFFESGGLNINQVGADVTSVIGEIDSILEIPRSIYMLPDIIVNFNVTNNIIRLKIIKASDLVVALFLSSFHEFLSESCFSGIGDALFDVGAGESKNIEIQI